MTIKKQQGKLICGLGLIVLVLLLLPKGLAAQGPLNVQATPTRVRPTVVPDGGAVAKSERGAEINPDNCASLQGAAIHWGVGNLGGIGVQLQDSGWQVQAATSDDGRYQFGGLGVGVGTLTVNPGFSDLTPMINEAAVRLRCDLTTYAHLGLYGGDKRPTPPGSIRMQVSPATAKAGDMVNIRLTVANSLPNPISHVLITDLLPEGLTIEDVQTSAGQVEVLNGRFLTVNLDSLAQGGQADITILARTAPEWSDVTTLTNKATLFYAESAADQASGKIIIEPNALDATIAAVDQPAPAVSESAEAADANLAANAEPNDNPAPIALVSSDSLSELDLPPNTLPETGFIADTAVALPLGFLLAVGLFAKGASSIKRRKKSLDAKPGVRLRAMILRYSGKVIEQNPKI